MEETEIPEKNKTSRANGTIASEQLLEQTQQAFAFIQEDFPERYKILSLIGQGGMGCVLDAFDNLLKRACAIKVIKKELLNNTELLQRFRAEAELTASVNHPNIIQIYDISEIAKNPFFVMEKFSSQSLKTFLKKEKKISLKQLVPIFRQVIKGLKAAQKMNLLHRDIKPENILIDEEEHIKIIDFGLSKIQKQDSSSVDLTRSGVVLGSPHYMSPEQCTGQKDLNFKTDIYSAGATFYNLLTAKTPFASDSFVKLMLMHCQEKRPKVIDIIKDCPSDLSILVEQMMAISPEERPDYDAILMALEKIYENFYRTPFEVKRVNLLDESVINNNEPLKISNTGKKNIPGKYTSYFANFLITGFYIFMFMLGSAIFFTSCYFGCRESESFKPGKIENRGLPENTDSKNSPASGKKKGGSVKVNPDLKKNSN
ncbi:serine/threonine-protein kinase [Candidatus Riflebacteria bacterium]